MDRLAQTPRKHLQHCQRTGKGARPIGRWGWWFLPTMAGCALLWFLLTVFPAYGRIHHHGLPFACALLLLVSGAGIVFGIRQLRRARVTLSGASLLLGIGLAVLAIMSDPFGQAGAFTPTDNPNSPIGTGIGVHPGRVAWVRDPGAVQDADSFYWDSTNSFYWDDANNNQSNIDTMMGTSICWLAGQSTQSSAWHALFTSFNAAHGRGTVGYQPGQTVVIKVDLSNSINRSIAGVTDDNYYNNTIDTSNNNHMPVMYEYYSTAANEPSVSPQAVIALLRQLIDQAGVPPTNIYLYDSVRYWGYEYWRAFFYRDKIQLGKPLPDESVQGAQMHAYHEFDGVHFVDCLGLQGREQAIQSTTLINYSNQQGIYDTLPTVAAQANYLINFATLKKGTAGLAAATPTTSAPSAPRLRMFSRSPGMPIPRRPLSTRTAIAASSIISLTRTSAAIPSFIYWMGCGAAGATPASNPCRINGR